MEAFQEMKDAPFPFNLSCLTNDIAWESVAPRALKDSNMTVHQRFNAKYFACVTFSQFFKQPPGVLLAGGGFKG
jgi:hypothetical protein